MAASLSANNFRAADQVYLGALAHLVSGDVVFKSDVYISNLSDASVDVDVAFSQGFGGLPGGTLNIVRVGTLAAGERKTYQDFAVSVLGKNPADFTLGQAVFFGCQTGGDCSDCDANPAACKNISVESRVYADKATNCRGGSATCSTGQLFSGIPFYNYASITAADRGLDKIVIVGITQTGTRATDTTPGSGFRTNIGLINASNTTSTTLKVTLFRNDNTQVGVFRQNMGPLGHAQLNVATMFPGFTGQGFAIVEQESWTPNAGETAAVPGFLAYGSMNENVTDDPITLEAQYIPALDYACVYGTAKPEHRLVKRH